MTRKSGYQPTVTEITQTLFKLDYENDAPDWWDAAHEAPDCPPALAPLIHGSAEEVNVPTDHAAACLAWCESLPGWSSGPDYASTALQVVEGT
jgi:hypothetical protein